MSWPKRLKKQLSRFSMPAAISSLSTPSAVNSRIACGNKRDADAELGHLRRPLIDIAGDAALLQVQRQRQPANAAADDRDFHARPIRLSQVG